MLGITAAKRSSGAFRWRLLAIIYLSCLLYLLLQGGKMSVMCFCILNALLIYLTLGYWSGIRRISGIRTVAPAGSPDSGTVSESDTLASGTSLQVSLQLKLAGFYPLPYVLVRERLQRNGSEAIPFELSFIPNVKRMGEVVYTTPPLSRGIYRFLPSECSARDVFGFFEHTGIFHQEGVFAVRPRTIALRGWETVRSGAKGGFSHASAPRASRETTQINGIREFLPGDRLSRIHWGATAKTGQWKSKEFEREALPRTIVLLDARRRGDAGAGDRFEVAVSAAASLLEHGLKRGTSMGLWISSSAPAALQARSGGDQLLRALELLTLADNDGDAGIGAALAGAEPVLERGSLVVLVSDAAPEEISGAMSWLSRQGMNPCCVRIKDGQIKPGAGTGIGIGTGTGTGTGVRYNSGHPVFDISSLEQLPDVLGGRGAVRDAGS